MADGIDANIGTSSTVADGSAAGNEEGRHRPDDGHRRRAPAMCTTVPTGCDSPARRCPIRGSSCHNAAVRVGGKQRLGPVPTRSVVALIAALAVVTVACGGDEAPSAERFCGEIAANEDALVNPTLEYADDIEPMLDLYREIGELAPLGIDEEWDQLVEAYETASTVVPGDEASEQVALAAIYSSERSAAAIDRWLRANCAVDIGPVFTIVPHAD
jgi:hypothetical protein